MILGDMKSDHIGSRKNRRAQIRGYKMNSNDQLNHIRSDETRWDQIRLDNIIFDHNILEQKKSDEVFLTKYIW